MSDELNEKKDLLAKITDTGTNPPPPETPPVVKPAESAAIIQESDLLGGPESAAPTIPAATAADILGNTPPPQPQAQTETKPRGRGRPPGSKNKPAADFSDIPGAVAAETLADYQAMSGALFDMTTGVLTNVLGPEWQPHPVVNGVDERGAVVGAMAVYLKSKQAKDIPPGWMLTFVVLAYAAPRLQQPSTKEKLMPMLSWTWMKMKSFFTRKKPDYVLVPATKQ